MEGRACPSRARERRAPSGLARPPRSRVHPRCAGRPPPVASWLRRLRRSAKRRIASTRSSFVDSSSASTPAVRKAARSCALALLRGRLEAPAEAAIVGVDEQLLAGLGILRRRASPRSGSSISMRVVEPHGDDVVALREPGQRLRPARRADEVGDDEHQRAARRHALGGLQQLVQAVLRSPARARAASASCAAGAAPGGARCVAGIDRVDAVAVEQRADAVAVARQDAREHGDEFGRDRPLLLPQRAEVNRRGSGRAGTTPRPRAPRCTRARTASAGAR